MKLKLLFLLTLVSYFSVAQLQTPVPSPAAKVKQVVGLTDVKVEYSRPSMKGREIFGGLVPYDKIWRTGANQNTTITFGDDVMLNDVPVTAGTYAIYTIPSEEKWTFILYSKTDNWGVANPWEEDKVVAKFVVTANKKEKAVESFSIWFSNLTMESAKLNFAWENAHVAFKVITPAIEKSEASIKETLSKDDAKAQEFYQAAAFYYGIEKDYEQAAKWMATAVEKKDDAFWFYRQQSLILAKLGDKESAIKAAEKSVELAQKAGNEDYVRMNKASIKEWSMEGEMMDSDKKMMGDKKMKKSKKMKKEKM